MFNPEFSYTHTIVKNLMGIEGAKEVIENSPILPIWQSRLQKDALIREAHHTTQMVTGEQHAHLQTLFSIIQVMT